MKKCQHLEKQGRWEAFINRKSGKTKVGIKMLIKMENKSQI